MRLPEFGRSDASKLDQQQHVVDEFQEPANQQRPTERREFEQNTGEEWRERRGQAACSGAAPIHAQTVA